MQHCFRSAVQKLLVLSRAWDLVDMPADISSISVQGLLAQWLTQAFAGDMYAFVCIEEGYCRSKGQTNTAGAEPGMQSSKDLTPRFDGVLQSGGLATRCDALKHFIQACSKESSSFP